MFTALFSFLGGSVFRMIFGEFSSFITKRQDNKHELEMMAVQAANAAAEHAQHMEALKLQSELQIATVKVQGEQRVAELELEGWSKAVATAMTPTGVWLVDLWNGVIRPAAATIALILWVYALNAAGWKMTEWDKELVGVILGFFFASRMMMKSGK